MPAPLPPAPDNPLIGWFVAVGGAVGTAAIAMWKWLSANKLSQAGSQAQLDVIEMLKEQLNTERSRADAMMQARDDALQIVNQLRVQVASLETQIARLTAQQAKLEQSVNAAVPPSTPT